MCAKSMTEIPCYPAWAADLCAMLNDLQIASLSVKKDELWQCICWLQHSCDKPTWADNIGPPMSQRGANAVQIKGFGQANLLIAAILKRPIQSEAMPAKTSFFFFLCQFDKNGARSIDQQHPRTPYYPTKNLWECHVELAKGLCFYRRGLACVNIRTHAYP